MDLPFVREAVKNLFSRSSCDMYPLKPSEAAEQYRGRIEYDPTKCINCHFCERVCAGGAISVVEVPVEEGTQITRTFDLSTCTFCNTCADFCNTHAIKLTKDYHMIGLKEGDLLVSGTFVKTAKKKPAPPPAEAKPEEKATPAIKPQKRKALEARRGQVCLLRHLRGSLPQESNHHVIANATNPPGSRAGFCLHSKIRLQ